MIVMDEENDAQRPTPETLKMAIGLQFEKSNAIMMFESFYLDKFSYTFYFIESIALTSELFSEIFKTYASSSEANVSRLILKYLII